MDVNLQKYYEDRFSMMGTPGWAELMVDVQKMLDNANSLDSVESEKTLHFRKGEVSIMRWLLTLKSVSEQAYEELK